MWEYSNYAELYHHGILGQKWGVRRFQNADGSLTEAGRKRYGVDEFRWDTGEIKRQATEMRLNHKNTRYRIRKAANRATLGLSLNFQIRNAWAKHRVKAALEDAARNYIVVYDEAHKKYVVKEKGSDA